MGTADVSDRQVRAARNQAMFREINEQMRSLNEGFAQLTGTFEIVCECADTGCTRPLELTPDEYQGVRSQSNRFIVLADHVIPDVERVVAQVRDYLVVEKLAAGAAVAEALDAAGGR